MTPSPQDDVKPMAAPTASPAAPALGADALVAIIGATLQLLLRSQIGTRKEDLTWQMSTIARSLRQGERELTQHDQASLAGYAGSAADQIETAARYLHDHDFNTILGDFDRLAHERPAVVMGAMLGIGVIIGRFIKHAGPAPAGH
ncbi:MAG: hypothetical protein H0X24_13360 [Ktedonobacterales bacterium]|nr:hypothetical protein [Ktedonobacterales bacterium]